MFGNLSREKRVTVEDVLGTKFLIINDLHLGLRRKTGVTQKSLEAFNEFQLNVLYAAVAAAMDSSRTLIVLGDLFDSGNVALEMIWAARKALRHAPGVLLVKGNHDYLRNLTQMSAFDLLERILGVNPVLESTHVSKPGFYIVPHLVNQQSFDTALAGIPVGATVLAHCNFDNGFAVESDHSLNMSREQAERFGHVILAHEHVKRDLPGVDILGSLYPCNIAEASVAHGYHLWDGPGTDIEFVETWSPSDYLEIDWHEIQGATPTQRFVRVVGEASSEEATTVIDLVAKFRAESGAFFVTNSVKVGALELGSLEDQNLEGFDPLEILKEVLPVQYHEKLEGLRA